MKHDYNGIVDLILFDTDQETTAYGRNGRMKCVGLDITVGDTHIDIRPINTRGVGVCRIGYPIAHLQELIDVLTAIKNATNQ